MSKMSRIAMELDEQAVEWGFRDREDAEAHGLAVAYGKEGAYLYKPQPEDEQLKAHEAWLKERDEVIESLNNAIYHNYKINNNKDTYERIVMRRARDFIKKGEY